MEGLRLCGVLAAITCQTLTCSGQHLGLLPPPWGHLESLPPLCSHLKLLPPPWGYPELLPPLSGI